MSAKDNKKSVDPGYGDASYYTLMMDVVEELVADANNAISVVEKIESTPGLIFINAQIMIDIQGRTFRFQRQITI